MAAHLSSLDVVLNELQDLLEKTIVAHVVNK
jgi:hypothetical protein